MNRLEKLLLYLKKKWITRKGCCYLFVYKNIYRRNGKTRESNFRAQAIFQLLLASMKIKVDDIG